MHRFSRCITKESLMKISKHFPTFSSPTQFLSDFPYFTPINHMNTSTNVIQNNKKTWVVSKEMPQLSSLHNFDLYSSNIIKLDHLQEIYLWEKIIVMFNSLSIHSKSRSRVIFHFNYFIGKIIYHFKGFRPSCIEFTWKKIISRIEQDIIAHLELSPQNLGIMISLHSFLVECRAFIDLQMKFIHLMKLVYLNLEAYFQSTFNLLKAYNACVQV